MAWKVLKLVLAIILLLDNTIAEGENLGKVGSLRRNTSANEVGEHLNIKCDFQASPVPPYHTPNEDSLSKLKEIMNKMLIEFGASTINNVNSKMSDQIIKPNLMIEDPSGSTRNLQWNYMWGYQYYMNFSCDQCDPDDGDDTGGDRLLASSNNNAKYEGIADYLAVALYESGIPYFKEIECVIFECGSLFLERSAQCNEI